MTQYAERLGRMPKYIFVELEKLCEVERKKGTDIISLGIGDPDLPTPGFVLDALSRAASDPKNHGYSSSQGAPEYRQAVCRWMENRFGVKLDAGTEVCSTIGSKEGIANMGRAFVGNGDIVLCPDPGYPVYANGTTILSDGIPVKMPLLAANGYLPDFDAIRKEDAEKAVLMFLNYPNNPTGATCDKKFLEEALEFAKKHDIVLAYDNAYSEFTFDGYHAPSILEVADISRDSVIEFNSLSKTFCMTGDRVGFAVGNEKIVDGLKKVKGHIDSGIPPYVQKAAAVALDSYTGKEKPPEVRKIMDEYEIRSETLVSGLLALGIKAEKPRGTFYVWADIRGTGMNSMDFAKASIKAGVMLTPGTGFGECGEGYVRLTVTQDSARIKEALGRLASILR